MSVNEVNTDLMARLERLIATARAEGRREALDEVRQLVGGAEPREPGRLAESKPARKTGKTRRNPWEGLSPAERLAKVNALRVGRGLAPKAKL